MSAAELRRLLAEATKGPWERVTEGNFDQRHAAASAFLSVMATKAKDNPDIQFSDMTYIRVVGARPNVALVGNGPKQTENGDLIVAAVNALPDLLDRIDALEAVVDAARDLTAAGCWGHSHHGPERCSAGRLREALDKLDAGTPPVTEGPITDANGDELEHGEPDPGSPA